MIVTFVFVPTARLIESGFAARLNPMSEDEERPDARAGNGSIGSAVKMTKGIPIEMNNALRND